MKKQNHMKIDRLKLTLAAILALSASAAHAGPKGSSAPVSSVKLEPIAKIDNLERVQFRILNSDEKFCQKEEGSPLSSRAPRVNYMFYGNETVGGECPLMYSEAGNDVLTNVHFSTGLFYFGYENFEVKTRDKLHGAEVMKFVSGLGWMKLPGTYSVSYVVDDRFAAFVRDERDCNANTGERPRWVVESGWASHFNRQVAECPAGSTKRTIQERLSAGEVLEDGYDGQIIVVNKRIALLEDSWTECKPADNYDACRVTRQGDPVCKTHYQEFRTLEEACR